MTKLFLQSGKLMIGEFPEEPIPYGVGDEQYYGARMDEYHAAIESAKASAVEITNGEEATRIIIEQDEQPTYWKECLLANHLYDLPSGWTVEIEETLESSAASLSDGTGYAKVTPTIIARLVPSENAQGEKPGSGWSKGNLNVQYVGGIVAAGIAEPIPEKGDKGGECYRALCSTKEAYWYNHSTQRYYCQACAFLINDHNKLDAMRLYGHDLCTLEAPTTGIAEAEQPEALAFLNEDDWTVPESGENAEHIPQWIVDYDANNFSSSAGKAIRILMNKLKSVSLPPQAESDVLLSWLEEERNILLNSATLMWHDMETRGRAKHTAECITTTINYIRESRKQPTNQ